MVFVEQFLTKNLLDILVSLTHRSGHSLGNKLANLIDLISEEYYT